MRASASMPLVSNIVEVDGHRLLDGGMTDSIPLEYFIKQGYDKNVVVLTQPRNYEKKKNKLMPLITLLLRKYKGLVVAMSQRHNVYNRQKQYVFECEKKGSAFVIAPKEKLCVSRLEHDKDKLKSAYDAGRQAALDSLDGIRKFLAE